MRFCTCSILAAQFLARFRLGTRGQLGRTVTDLFPRALGAGPLTGVAAQQGAYLRPPGAREPPKCGPRGPQEPEQPQGADPQGPHSSGSAHRLDTSVVPVGDSPYNGPRIPPSERLCPLSGAAIFCLHSFPNSLLGSCAAPALAAALLSERSLPPGFSECPACASLKHFAVERLLLPQWLVLFSSPTL